MDHFKRIHSQTQFRIFLALSLGSLAAVLLFSFLDDTLDLPWAIALAATAGVIYIIALAISGGLTTLVLDPVKHVWQAVLHIDPDHQGTPAPNLDDLRIGRELVSSLVTQIYQFASQQNSKDLIDHRIELSQAANVVNHLPLPLFILNKQQLVTNTSSTALEYCQLDSAKLYGKPLYDVLRLEFPSENTLHEWIRHCQDSKVTDTASWERVRVLNKEDGKLLKQCDITAYYNRDNPSGTEFIVTLFDRTERYGVDDDALSFISLAVHELRTPITMLRGYIEVFEDELSDKLDPEMTSFMQKMDASAKQLSSYVNNILNVARVDQNQLILHLTEASWPEVLKTGTADMLLRAKVNDRTVKFEIVDDLPTVAVDQLSICEVLNNMLENAIKYSGTSKEIIVRSSLNKDGLVETTVQDFGVGIPASVLPTLFEKFSRNHRTRSEVSGTGLGLYLCKAIVTAHGGQVWGSSKAGEGSTFGFSILPYSKLTDELKESGNKEITRGAHGWIKNHSLYKR